MVAATSAGSKPLQRLNKAEYDNTLRELFGVDDHPAADWPDDGVSFGFDNVAEGLSVTPVTVQPRARSSRALSPAPQPQSRARPGRSGTSASSGGLPAFA